MTTVKSACVEPTTGIALQFDHWGYRHASRKHFAVRGLDLKIHAGEHVLLLGASGIGKSTILEGLPVCSVTRPGRPMHPG